MLSVSVTSTAVMVSTSWTSGISTALLIGFPPALPISLGGSVTVLGFCATFDGTNWYRSS